jgi:phosphatidylinositol alpha-1,6-mannosyltransferase
MLSVARLVPYKGLDTGLLVLAELGRRYPDLGYLIVGSGEQLGDLRTMAARLGLQDRVYFLTAVSDQELPALYNLAEIYLGLTRATELDVEGFGISLVEASACGLPVVAARTGGIPDAVREGETGVLVNPEDPRMIADAVAGLLDNRELARDLGMGGRRAVESYYNWKRVTSELIGIGRELGSKRTEVTPL